MSARNVLVIARKEFRDVLRDRRTLIFMMLMPLVFMPVLLIGISNFMKAKMKEKETKVLRVAGDQTTESLLRGLAARWYKANFTTVVFVANQLDAGQMEAGLIEGLGKLTERIEAVKEAGAKGGEGGADAAMLTYFKAYQDLTDGQKQLLRDGGAVHRFLNQTQFVRFKGLDVEGTLAQGVEIPENLPGRLGDPAVAYAIQDKTITAAVHIDPEAADRLDDTVRTVPVHILYDSSIGLSEECYDRLYEFIHAIGRHEVNERLAAHRLLPGFIEPFDVQQANVATKSRRVQAFIGGFLPYLIILFSFMGALYPALDIAAGEKERFTLETLLLAPASRMDIAVGKFIVVFVAAVLAAILTVTSMALTFNFGILPEDALQELQITFDPLAVMLTASLLLPVAALFAAMLLAVAIYARSYKEAQSYAVPLNFVVAIPAIMALLPDLEMTNQIAWIPLVNVSLLTRELLKGNYLWDFYGITLASTVVVTGVALWITSRMFQREAVLLRS